MVDFEDGIESDVEQASSEPNESEESVSDNEGGAASIDDQKDLDNKPVPYSRFKEINEQSKEYAAKLAAMEQKLASLTQQRQQPTQTTTPKVDKHGKLLDRLQGIDPEFGEYNREIADKLARLEKLEANYQKQEAEGTRRQANEALSKLYTEHKVSGEDQEIYEARIRALAADGKIKSLDELPQAFKEVHDKYTKYIDSIRRSERAKYVTDKAKDASKPTSQPKGQPTKGPAPKQFSMDREEAKAELVKSIMAKRRAASDI